MSLPQAEASISAPKVTEADIDAAILTVNFINAHEAAMSAAKSAAFGGAGVVSGKPPAHVPWELQVLTIALVTLRNGFTVIGKSACAAPENYDRKLGEDLALKDARRQIWPLMGYALRDRLMNRRLDAGAQSAREINGAVYGESPFNPISPEEVVRGMAQVNAAIRRELDNTPMELTSDMEVKDIEVMPRWRCHKQVWASKIMGLEFRRGNPWLILSGRHEVMISPETWGRIANMPKDGSLGLAGGYYIRYADGYESWSPAKAFEEGYTRI